MDKYLAYDGVTFKLDAKTDVQALTARISKEAAVEGGGWVAVEDHQWVTHRIHVGQSTPVRVFESAEDLGIPRRAGDPDAAVRHDGF